MKPEDLDKLLEKYERAETSLQEERALKNHFAQQDVENDMQAYQSIFSAYQHEQKRTVPEIKKPEKSQAKFKWMKIAAVLIVIIAAGFIYKQYQYQQELKQQQAQEAFDQTKEVLELVATEFQKGKSNLILLKDINQTKDEFIK